MNSLKQVDVSDVIDGAAFGAIPFWVIVIGILCMTTDGFDLQSMSFAAPAVATEWAIRRELLGPVLAASIVGMAVGSVLLGWIGDRIGRKRSFAFCFALMAFGSLGSSLSATLLQLMIFRFVTGIALGGAAPLATALVAEWMPKRWRTLGVATVIVAVPAGGMIGGMIAEHIVPAYGWRSVFAAGAAIPLLCLFVTLFKVPESPLFLASRPERRSTLAELLNRLKGSTLYSGQEVFTVAGPRAKSRNELVTLLRAPYLAKTLVLWATFSLNTLALYGFVNWLPTIVAASGESLVSALRSAVFFNVGGVVGAICGSLLISSCGSRLVGSSMALIAVLAMLIVGTVIGPGHGIQSSTWSFAAVSICGMCLNGTQVFLYAVAANAYPTAIRATAVGCAAAVSRIGGVASSAVGSAIFLFGLSIGTYFYVLAAVAVGVMLGFLYLGERMPAVTHTDVEPSREGR